jgi:putative transposase
MLIAEGLHLEDLKKIISVRPDLSQRRQCELLGIHRSNLFYKRVEEKPENLKIMRLMDEEHLKHPAKGVEQMVDFMLTLNILVGPKRVRRLLRKMGIMSIYPQRNMSKLGIARYIHPYKLRKLEITHSNQVWSIDITYIPMKRGFLYLTAIIDVYSRYIVGWGLFNSLDSENTLEVLRQAIARHGKPEIINSDQGSQFTCQAWIDLLTEHDIEISMDGRGRCLDNIWIERFWRTLKREYVYLNPAENGRDLLKGIKWYIEYYNNQRTHRSLSRQTPFQWYEYAA